MYFDDCQIQSVTNKIKTNNTENRITQPECAGKYMQVKSSRASQASTKWLKKKTSKTQKLLGIFPYPCRSRMTDTAVDASRPVVGSSRNSTDGDIINSIPILVRFLSPPEIPRMNSFPTCESKSEIRKGQGNVFLLVSFVSECLLSLLFTFCLIIILLCAKRRNHST